MTNDKSSFTMKKSITLIIFICLGISSYSQSPGYANLHILDPYNPEFVPGEVLVKFKDDVPMQVSMLKNMPQTGLTSVDEFISRHNITVCEKVFANEQKRVNLKMMTTPDGQTFEVPQLFNIYKFKATETTDVKAMIEELKEDPLVDFTEPNYYFYTQEVLERSSGIRNPESRISEYSSFLIPNSSSPIPVPSPTVIPNDPLYSQQWYLPAVNAPEAWDSVTGDTSQIIGIIDTGVDWDHPDLDDNIWTNWNEIPGNGVDDDGNGYIDDIRGWDFVNNDNNPNDDNSHGTHVAGIAAAEGNNGVGICGVSWNSRILPVKVLQSSGYGSSSDIASGVIYAWQNNATVLNLSLGSYGESLTLKTALENAYSSTVIVAAAGNNTCKIDPNEPLIGIVAPYYPACYSWVLGVMATKQSGALANFSNFDQTGPIIYRNQYGYNYESKAPGVEIISCKPNGTYWQKSGTSMATPIVAGAILLMRQRDTTLSVEEIFAKLIQGANSGILDIYNSLIIDPIPALYYIDFTITDTLSGCDGDGRADAGETIQIIVSVKNAGGPADSVWAILRLDPNEDTNLVSINDSIALIGSISSYATLTNSLDPFEVYIPDSLSQGREIAFDLIIKNFQTSITTSSFNFQVENATEVSGLIYNNTTWTADKLYLVNGNVRIMEGIILTVKPGTTILFADNRSLDVRGTLFMEGKPDSLIILTKLGEDLNTRPGEGIRLHYGGSPSDSVIIKYCRFENLSQIVLESELSFPFKKVIIQDNIFQNNRWTFFYLSPQPTWQNQNQFFSFSRNNAKAAQSDPPWPVIFDHPLADLN